MEIRYPPISIEETSRTEPSETSSGVLSSVPLSHFEAPSSNPLSPGLLSPSLVSSHVGANGSLASTSTRARSSTMASYTSSLGDGDESSDDSVLSWWSDAGSDEDSEDDDEEGEEGRDKGVDEAEQGGVDKRVAAVSGVGVDSREEKERERKRREEERLQILNAAGLKLRREPPGIPLGRKGTRRRAPPAPGARRPGQKQRRRAPAVPSAALSHRSSVVSDAEGAATREEGKDETVKPIETQDAYARYEQFLAESQRPADGSTPTSSLASGNRPVISGGRESRPSSYMSDQASATSPVSMHSTLGALAPRDSSSGGRLSGLFSRIMAPNTGGGERKSGPSISGPITRVDEGAASGMSTPGTGGGAGGVSGGGAGVDFGKTWSSLIDPGVLASMSDRERKRQEVSSK